MDADKFAGPASRQRCVSVAVYADGSVIEMATIGREGCTGMQAFFGAKTSSVRLLTRIPRMTR